MYQSYGAQSPDLTNNPFITDPSNAQSRFPDISSASSPDPYNTQYNAWMQSQGTHTHYRDDIELKRSFDREHLWPGSYDLTASSRPNSKWLRPTIHVSWPNANAVPTYRLHPTISNSYANRVPWPTNAAISIPSSAATVPNWIRSTADADANATSAPSDWLSGCS